MASAPPASALTYFVRASGDDANDGTSPATAFATISRAAGELREPGDRVVVGPGTYREGNIQPRASGTPDAPIVFLADPMGKETGDAPGGVVILPPNTELDTTGFLVFGRHDIVIEGFSVDEPADAGIQVRTHFSTGVDSTRITVRGNTIRNAGQRGIHVIAAGDVEVSGNIVSGSRFVGVALMGGRSGRQRPFVGRNLIEGNAVGVVLESTFGGTIVENVLRSNREGMSIIAGNGLTIRDNEVDGTMNRAIDIEGGTDLELAGNDFRRGVRAWVTGTVVVADNRFPVPGTGLAIRSGAGGIVRIFDNQLGGAFVTDGARLEFERNEGERLEAQGTGEILAVENRLTGSIEAFAVARVELRDNRASGLEARGAQATVSENEFAHRVEIAAAGATVTGNTASLLVLRRPRPRFGDPPGEPDGSFLVRENVSIDLLRVGEVGAPLSNGVVEDNTVDGMLRVFARGEVQVRGNEAGGISCVDRAGGSRLVLSENRARGSMESGLIVVGAGSALVENNTSSDNESRGLAVRRVRDLTVVGNAFRSNGEGGISLQGPPLLGGDCNDDRAVTIDEVIKTVAIAAGQRRLSECPAADFDGDERVGVDELVRAVGGALGVIAAGDQDLRGGRVEFRSNRVEDNGGFGIKLSVSGAVTARDNVVLGNGGIAIAVQAQNPPAEIEILDNVLGTGELEGLLLEGVAGARVRDNLIFGHGAAGILLRNAPGAEVINNLVYDNGNDGVAVGTGTLLPAPNATVANNTLYANTGWGVTIGTAGAPSTGAVILNNILDGNRRGGVAAEADSLPGLTIGFNLNNDGYSFGVVPSVTDFVADPRFVRPAGRDGVLGGAGYADDDLHLQPASPAIDAGSATAAELGITGSAVAGRDTDGGVVDLGFHYGADGSSEGGRSAE